MTTDAPAIASPELVLVRYGELALKGGNRKSFERALMRNIREVVEPISPARIDRSVGRITLWPERRGGRVAARAADVFGVKSVSPAWGVENDPEAIAALGKQLLMEALEERKGPEPVTFRVRAKRADKRFPMRSTELEHFVGERVLPGPERVKVQLRDPELTLGVEVRDRRTFLFLKRIPGPGGLPVGTIGRGLCLISGGIDSPVAAWMAMKRGLNMGYVTFHSAPYIGEGYKKKVTDLVRTLCRWQPSAALFVVPFAEIQTEIRDRAPEEYRTVLYRRTMQRIAARLADRNGYLALVTGECLGQVASQTLENMTCIGEASERLVLRPLVTFDKEEVISVARKIGTLDISNVPEPDCCTVFQPSRPVIRGRVTDCRAIEASMELDPLIESAVANVEQIAVEAR